MTFFTRKLLSAYDDIHNTVRHDNKLHHGLAVQGAFHALKLQDGGLDLRYTRFGVRDMGVPADGVMADVLEKIDLELSEHRPVYVHCLGGVGRTGTVAGCWLIEQGLAAEQALDGIARLRRGLPGCSARSPETDAQCAVVRAWPPRSDRSRADP